MAHNVKGGLQYSQVGARLPDTLVCSATLGFPLYFLGGLAGDLYHFHVAEALAELVGMVVGLAVLGFMVFGAMTLLNLCKTKHGTFVQSSRRDLQRRSSAGEARGGTS